MAVLEHVELAVDGGGVTVARRLAYYSYGKFDVVLPEDREQVEFDDRIQNAYISCSPGARMGRFDFGFIRADATVNLESGTSDLELAIDSTSKRSEGDVFVERDVSPAGFRGHRPGVDFGLDDLVFLRVWGNRLRLPVTAIDMSASISDGPHASRVHLGGQLVSDGETRRRANNEILLQIAQEKRQRLRQVKSVDSKASSAVSAASAAQDTADEALRAATDADGTIQQKLDEQARLSAVFSSNVTRAESAADKASQAFNNVDGLINSPDGAFRRGVSDALAAQDSVNRAQQEVNATQANINRQQGEINDALKQATTAATNAAADAVKTSNAVSTATRISNAQQDSAIKLAQNSAYLQRQTAVQVVMTRNGQIIPNDYIDGALSKESWGIGGTRLSKFTFTAKGDWAGSLAIQIITSSGDVDYKNYGVGPGARGTSFSTEGPVDIEGLFINIQIYYGNSPRKFALVADSGRRLKIGSVIMAAFESPGGLYANLLEGDPVDWRSSGHVRFPGLAVKPDAAVYCLSADSQSVTRVEPGSVIPAGTSVLAAQDPDGLKRVVEFST